MTVAIYARYSSDLQTEKSIADQLARCRDIARAYASGPAEVFTDQALSGASTANRPGLLALLRRLEQGRISIIITESLDRLSRDQADLALIYRATKTHGARLITASDGEISAGAGGIMQVGIRAIFGAMFLADLGDKTRRGQIGVALDGRIPGGLCYGYRALSGEVRGRREIEPAEAAVIERIYRDYAERDLSPRAIAAALNGEGIPGPRGGEWTFSTLLGNAKRLNGILCNPLYNGELVFNRQHKVKNPETGRARMVPNPQSEWKRIAMPDLRIVEAGLFAAAQAVRSRHGGARAEYHRRPKRALSGLLACASCGGPYAVIANGGRLGCVNKRNRGTCSNGRTVLASVVEARVFGALRDHLLEPAAVEYAVAVYHQHMAELDQGKAKRRAIIEKEIAGARRSIETAKRYIRDGKAPPDWLYDAATDGENLIKARAGELADMESPSVVAMHPGASKHYRRSVERLNQAIEGGAKTSDNAEAAIALRRLISRIIIAPGQGRGKVEIEIEGDLAALLGLTSEGGRVVPALGAGTGSQRKHNSLAMRLTA